MLLPVGRTHERRALAAGRQAAVLLAGALLTAVCGCAAVTYRRSQPVRSPEIVKLRYGRAVVEHADGFDLAVAVHNRAIIAAWLVVLPIPLAGWSPTASRLHVWIEIDSQGAPVRFDPSRMRVVNARGDTLEPVRWYGPGGAQLVREELPVMDGTGECECVMPRDWEQPDWAAPFWERVVRYDTSYTSLSRRRKAPASIPGAREIRKPGCFVVTFEGKRAGHDFTLLPGTIEGESGPREPAPVRFKKGLDGRYMLWPVGL